MKNISKLFLSFLATAILLSSCKEKEYVLGDLKAPTNLVITTVVKGTTTATPNGDGSGDVTFTLSAENALSFKIDYDATNSLDLVYLPTGTTTKKYTTLGTNTYKVTAVAYGRGGTSTTITKDITVQSNFTPDAAVVANLTGGSSKTWIVDKSVGGHFGVGPWSGSIVPEWWAAGANEKPGCGLYDDKYIFYLNGFKFDMITNGDVYIHNSLAASFPGSFQNLGDFTAPYQDQLNKSWTLTEGTENTITLSNGAFLGFYTGVNTYRILDLTDSTMTLQYGHHAGGLKWYIRLKTE